MNAAELITKLQALPDHSKRVIVRGYEGGYHDITKFEFVNLRLNVHKEWYYGNHDEARGDEDFDEVAIEVSA